MHKRSFLIGIGIGIIMGALLLVLFDLGEKSQQQLKEIEQQLNDNASPIPSTAADAEPTQSPDDSSTPESAPASLISPSEPAPASEPDSPNKPDTPIESELDQQPVPSSQSVDKPKVSYILRVYPGDTISKTGNQLAEHHIIEDAEKFVTYFKSHNATIRAGFFLVEEETSLDDLLNLFASQPLTESEATGQIKENGIQLIH